MSITETWERVRAERDAGGPLVPGSVASAARTGEEWVKRSICEPHNIDPDDLVKIHDDICQTTVRHLLVMTDHLDIEMLLCSAIAAGFTNGIALGLEHR